MRLAKKRGDWLAAEAFLRELDMLAKLKCEETGWWNEDRYGKH